MTLTDYMQEVMRQLAQMLMIPVMIVLVLLIAVALFFVGATIVELVTERRHFRQNMPEAINAIESAKYSDLNDTICGTELLWKQKAALLMVANNAGLPEDALYALAKAEIEKFIGGYRRRVGRTDLLAKIGPMIGLMCTLIPLGPGIVAMGQGDVNTLSSSLGVAFDGTVAGLVSAVICMSISHVRKGWYSRYQNALESLMTTLLEKAEIEREAGTELPSGFTTQELEPLRLRAIELSSATAGSPVQKGRDK